MACLAISGPTSVLSYKVYTYTVYIQDVTPELYAADFDMFMSYSGGTLEYGHDFIAPNAIESFANSDSFDFTIEMRTDYEPGQSFKIAATSDNGLIPCAEFVVNLVEKEGGQSNPIFDTIDYCGQSFFWSPYHHATKKTPNTGIIRTSHLFEDNGEPGVW